MKFVKKLATLALSAVMLFTMAACGSGSNRDNPSNPSSSGGSSNAKTTVWRMAFVQTEDHPQYQVMLEFSQKFKEATEGRYEIQLFPNETLGDQRSTLEQVRTGTIEMTIVNNTHPGSVSDYFNTFDIPFVFADLNEAMKFMKESPIMDTIKADTVQYGFDVAAYMPAGTRSMYTATGPIHSVDDMKGLKIRTMESDTYTKMMNCFGGSATPMSLGELYSAIQSGVVNGAENNEVTYVNSKHYEVAPYWSQTNHLIVPDWLLINHDVYAGLSDADRAAFDELCAWATDEVAVRWDKNVEDLMASLDTSKVTITSDVDTQSFVDAVKPLHDELCAANAHIKEVYDAIQEMK